METNTLNKIKCVLEKNRRNRNIKNYYLKKMKNGKSYNAVLIDSLFVKIIFTSIFFLFTYYVFKKISVAIIISIFIFVGLLYSNYHIKKHRFKTKTMEINDDLGKKRIIKEISCQTNYEFAQYIKGILETYYSTKFTYLDGSDIDFVGDLNGEGIGIKCIRLSQDERLTKRDVKSFKHSLEKANLKNGIFLTSSYFVDEIKLETINNIILLDFDDLINIIKDVNLFPTKEEIEEHILSRYAENKRKLLESKERIFKSNKIKKYLLLSLCLFVLSKITTYSSYYLVMAIIALLLGLISFTITVFNIVNMRMKD